MDKDFMQVLDHTASALKQAETTFRQRVFCPEANRYSRAFTDRFLKAIETLTQSEIFLFLNLVFKMDSNNMCTTKTMSKIGMPKITLRRSIKTLCSKYLIFIYPDNKVFINPSLVVLTKYKLSCLKLIAEWNKLTRCQDSIQEDESEN